MPKFVGAARLRVGKITLFAGASVAALLIGPGAVLAQCAPNPPAPGSFNCTGTDADGLYLTSSADVYVAEGATVLSDNPTSRGIFLEIPRGTGSAFFNLTVDGTIQAGAGGVRLSYGQTGPISPPPGPINATIRVGRAGKISGSVGIITSSSLGQPINVNFLSNAGIIESTTVSGPIALASSGAQSRFNTIVNETTGQIKGAIFAEVDSLENQGLIDGGTEVAVTRIRNRLGNSGTIRGGSAVNALITTSNTVGIVEVFNMAGGIIDNTTTAAAISGTGVRLNVTNEAGARILSAGPVAITATAGLGLTNRGAITGGISSTTAFANMIDTSQGGTITGNILLGSGNDLVTVDFGSVLNPITGVVGTIDAGAGVDTIQYHIGGATTLEAPLTAAATFEQARIRIGANGALTLASGFSAPPGFDLDWENGATLINNTNLGATPIGPDQLRVINNATLGAETITAPTMIYNRAGGTIASLTQNVSNGTDRGLFGTTIINVGAITGNVTLNSPSSVVYVADGGTIGGAFSQGGFGNLSFVDRGSGLTGIGSINPGLGFDTYVKSFATDGGYALGAALPAGFERGGIEALGSARVTVAGAPAGAAAAEGFLIFGTGNVVTTGRIGVQSFDGTGFVLPPTVNQLGLPAISYSGDVSNRRLLRAFTPSGTTDYVFGAALESFTNEGQIDGDVQVNTARFVNTGAINLDAGSISGTSIITAADRAFSFMNLGMIVTSGAPGARSTDSFLGTRGDAVRIRQAIDTIAPQDASFLNSGTINKGVDLELLARNFAFENTANGVLGETRISLVDKSDEGIPAPQTITLANAGQIDSGFVFEGFYKALGFRNTGTITGGTSILTDDEDDSTRDADTFDFVNTGTITVRSGEYDPAVYVHVPSKMVNVTNSGTVRLDTAASSNGYGNEAAVLVENSTIGSATTTFTNSGAITTDAIGAAAVAVVAGRGDELDVPALANQMVTVANSGRIAATGGTFYNIENVFDPLTNLSQMKGAVVLNGALVAAAIGADGGLGTVNITNANGAEIVASGRLRQGHTIQGPVANNPVIAAAPDATGMIAVAAIGDRVNIINDGRITGGAGTAFPTSLAATLPDFLAFQGLAADVSGTLLPNRYAAGAIQTFASVDTLRNNASGTITGSIDLGYLDDRIENFGAINGAVFLRDGNDAFVQSLGGSLTGTADGGTGTNTLTFDITGTGTLNQALLDRFVNFTTPVFTGTGTVAVTDGPLSLTTLNLVDANFTLAAGSTLKTAGTNALTYGVGSTVTNLGTIDSALDNATAFTNAAGGVLTGLLTNSAGTSTNAGMLGAGASVTGGTLTNSGSAGTVNVAAAGQFNTLAGGTADVVTNAGTTTNAGSFASLLQTAGTTTNSGTITGATDVTGGVLNTSGKLAGGLTNAATVNATGGTLGGAIVNSAGGTINVAGATTGSGTFLNATSTSMLNVNSGSLTLGGLLINNGNIIVETGAMLTDLAGIVNASGATIIVKENGRLIDALSNAGTVSNSGNYTADVSNSGAGASILNAVTGVWSGILTDNSAGATVQNLGRWNGTASNAATLTNAAGATWNGAVTNLASGTLSNLGAISGAVVNAGTFNNASGGGVSGLFTNTAGTASNAGAMSGGATISGGMLNNSGAAAAVDVATGGAFNTLSGGTAGAVTNAGTTTNAGTFASLVQSGGTTTNTGTVTGAINVTGGVLNTSGTLSGGLINAGTVNATGGAINGAIVNNAAGMFNVAGTVTGNGSFSNAASTSTLNVNSGGLTLAGALTNAGVINFNGGSLSAASLTNQTGGVINGIINLTSGADSIVNQGRVTGAMGLGAGDDSVTIQSGGTFAGNVDGGTGNDTLILAVGGTEAAPEMPGLGNFTGFERLRQTSGIVSLAGAFSIGAIDVTAGRLIGQAGSTITSGTITINAGAAFGSAGTVAANIVNNGTLAPGASPGVMNVTGNVNLASGSTTLFEMTPTISDQLIISGALTIASNATLTLTGARPLTPGSTFDLIVASGGITGSFGTINKPASVLGFIAQRGNRIQLLGQFAVDAALNPQTAATVNYVNSVLTGGTPSAGLIAALPSLLSPTGGTNATAFAQLNPEAYATASQVGTENGLSIANAMRSGGALTLQSDAGAFSFAQGLGDWRKLKGSTAQGVSKASINGTGVLGGLGYGSETASVAGFVGYLDAKQTIGDLGARNDADGIILGMTGRLASGGFTASATLAYDDAKAQTDRAIPGNVRATSNYKLKSFVADVTLGYGVAVGGDWEIAPHIGYTHVSTKRTAVSETGGTFALNVAGERYKAGFVDASINLTKASNAKALFQPILGVGVRHQMSGDAFRSATAGFAGATQTFAVTGAGRAETLVTGKAGFGYKLGGNATLFGQYDGEFGGSGGGHSVNMGVRIGF